MKTTVKVSKCTGSKNGGFILTLLAMVTVKATFGGERQVERKLFLKSPDEVVVGTTTEIDLNDYSVTVVADMYEGRPVAKTWIKEKTALSVINKVATVIDNRAMTVGGLGAF
jgi:hypothetical protein